MFYENTASDTEKKEIMNLNKCFLRHLYQAAGAGRLVGAVSMERRVAGEIPSVDHPELSNQLPAALPYSIHMQNTFNY